MTPAELDAFLAEQRTCRVATNSAEGPHATPLWFCWYDGAIWLYSITRSQRWADLQKDPRIGIVVDAGIEYFDLHGVEIIGTAEVVSEVPRTGAANDALAPVEAQFAKKYFNIDELWHDGKHAWLKIVPSKIASWDFRKINAG
jgi:hypothetical protein